MRGHRPAAEQEAQRRELPVQAHRRASHRPELAALVADHIVDQPVLDQVEGVVEFVRDHRDRVGEMAHDCFKQRHGAGKALAAVDGLKRACDGAERVAPATDHEFAGQNEPQPAKVAALARILAEKVRKHTGHTAAPPARAGGGRPRTAGCRVRDWGSAPRARSIRAPTDRSSRDEPKSIRPVRSGLAAMRLPRSARRRHRGTGRQS